MPPDARHPSAFVVLELERDEASALEDALAKSVYGDSIAWPLGRVLRKLREAL